MDELTLTPVSKKEETPSTDALNTTKEEIVNSFFRWVICQSLVDSEP